MTLRQLLDNTRVIPADMQNQVIFHPERYQRNLVQIGPYYHALVMCWQSGQQSPITIIEQRRAASKSYMACQPRFAPNAVLTVC